MYRIVDEIKSRGIVGRERLTSSIRAYRKSRGILTEYRQFIIFR